jgi:pectate lyase
MFRHSSAFLGLMGLSLSSCSGAGGADTPSETWETGGNTSQPTTAPKGGNAATSAIGGKSATLAGGSTSNKTAVGGETSTGGSSGVGGTVKSTAAGGAASGGGSSTSGAPATGAVVADGGSTATGGSSSRAGSSTTGGAATGGKSSTGGTTASSTGGTATGGKSSTGGATATGGAATGGTSSIGGAPVTGGSTNSTASTGSPETKPTGYGQATTGCGSTTYQQAATMTAMQSLIDAYSGTGGLCINYTGKFNLASISDPCTQHTLSAQTLEIKQKSNITILGADGSAANFGIHIASSSSNVIIRNMVFGLLPGGGDSDAISIEGMSGGVPTNIWIDHNELYSSMTECAGAGDTSFDGLIDAKKGADNITVSYNYLHDHHKVSLNGYSDSDEVVRHITFHHNLFENVGSRTPLQRHGYSHLLSNYFGKISVSGANIRMGGYSLIESNYFEDCKNPVTSRDSSELGSWDLRNNNIQSPADFATYKITWSASDSTPTKDATDWVTTATYPVALGYTYTADPPQCVKNGLRNVAGAGKGLATLKCN